MAPKKEKKSKKDKPFDQRQFIEKTLRGAFKKTPMFSEARNRAKREYFVKAKNGNDMRRVQYECAVCKRMFRDISVARCKEIAVDHIEPVVSTKDGYVDLITWVNRLFCSVDNLQVLCNYKGERDGIKSCHKIKTAKEAEEAAYYRNLTKEKT